MKIVIFGLTLSSSWGNTHADAWRGLGRALAQRGHRLSFYERDLSMFGARRDLGVWTDGNLWLFSSWDKVRFRAKRDLLDADVAIVTSGCPDAMAATSLIMDSPVPMRIFHDLDTAATLDYADSPLPLAYVPPETLKPFDLVISHSGGSALDELQTRLAARRVAALPAGVDLGVNLEAFSEDLRTVRTGLACLADYGVEEGFGFERLFAEPAARRPDLNFRLAGAAQQPGRPLDANVSYFHAISSRQRAEFFRSSRLVLNLNCSAQQRLGFSPSEPLFQAIGCGAPVITEEADGLGLFLEPGSEILMAKNADEVISALTMSDRELAGIASRAKERLRDEHTFSHRAIHFETLIETTSNAAEEEQLVRTRGMPAFESSVAE
jgi:spore maturation protein CgeB